MVSRLPRKPDTERMPLRQKLGDSFRREHWRRPAVDTQAHSNRCDRIHECHGRRCRCCHLVRSSIRARARSCRKSHRVTRSSTSPSFDSVSPVRCQPSGNLSDFQPRQLVTGSFDIERHAPLPAGSEWATATRRTVPRKREYCFQRSSPPQQGLNESSVLAALIYARGRHFPCATAGTKSSRPGGG